MKKALLIFLIGVAVLALLFFLLPINLFDGVIVYEDGIKEFQIETRLSLSYFIGIGYDPEDLNQVKYFYLTSKGILMAILFIVGFPALLAYRIYIRKK